MSRSYMIENRYGMPGAGVRVTDETPGEAREREAAWEAHRAAIRRCDELSAADARAAELLDDEPEQKGRAA